MKHVLIAEDNSDMAELLASVLNAEGFSSHASSDGLEAINYLKETQDKVDIVITDIVMPKNDGFDVIKYVRDNLDCKIIAITGGGTFITSKDALAAVSDQVDLCLQKPISYETIVGSLKEISA